MRRLCVLALAALTVLLLGAGPVNPTSASQSTPTQLFVQPGAHTAPVLNLIRSAKRSLRLEVYILTNRTIIGALAKSHQQGVDVRVLLEEHPFGGGRYAQLGYQALQQAGVPVRWANEGAFTFTHAKSMEVDGQVAGIFSFNFSSSGFFTNREFGIIDPNAADARALGTIFDADWNRRRPSFSDPRLVISPYNARQDLQQLADSARSTLDVYAEEVNDTALENHLIGAARRHVRVRLITSQTSSGVDYLRSHGVGVKLMPHPYVHAKALVADGRRFFVGSENISTTSLDANREVGIILDSASLAGIVERTFAGDWSGSAAVRVAPAPTSPPSTGGFSVTVLADPPSVRRGQLITITARTRPGASCTIRITYPDGYVSRASSLRGARTVGSSGVVSWSWHVGTRVAGTSTAGVTCALGSSTRSGSTTFDVVG